MPSSLPPYLTSGASSRAHHALLTRLHACQSAQEEDAVLEQEIKQCRGILAGNPSSSKVSDVLIILLHIDALQHQTSAKVDSALVHALKLAEGGRNRAERRIGYLYLVERLPKGHELGLMWINTIRKDLTSAIPQDNLLALHTIVKIAGHDLTPAVFPLLTSKRLLRHQCPAIRQRTLQALQAILPHTSSLPIALPRLIKRLSTEDDTSVFGALLRLLRHVLSVHAVATEEREYLVERVVEMAELQDVGASEMLGLEVVKLLGDAVSGLEESDPVCKIASEWIINALRDVSRQSSYSAAFLLEAARLPSSLALTPSVLAAINPLLLPAPSTSTRAPPRPNDHVLALRCLLALDKREWDGALGESEMEVIMAGLAGPDSTIRRLTVRLLHTFDPSLPQQIYDNLLDTIRDSSGVRRLAGAERALEVVDVAWRGMGRGRVWLERWGDVCRVMEDERVWEEGVRRGIEVWKAGPAEYRAELVRCLLEPVDRPYSPSLALFRANAFVEALSDLSHGQLSQTIAIIAGDIESAVDTTLLEVLLAGFAGLLAVRSEGSDGGGEDRDLSNRRVLEQVVAKGAKIPRKRARQILDLLDANILPRLPTRNTSLADMLDALVSLHASIAISPKRTSSAKAVNPQAMSSSSPRTLRYDAYDSP